MKVDIEKVQIFVSCAESFCTLVENHRSHKPYQFVIHCCTLLMDLYKAALNLPDIEPATNERTDHIDSIEVQTIAHGLSEKFKDHNFYLLIFDPFEKEDAVGSMISSDLSEIYEDVKGNLILFQTGVENNIRDAIWSWKFDFSSHWGRHLVNVIRPMHSLLFWGL